MKIQEASMQRPTSDVPAYGAPGGRTDAAVSDPPPVRRRPGGTLTVFLSVLCLVVVVLLGVAFVLVRRAGGTPDTARIDRCVVGTWQVTSYAEDVPVAGVGTVQFHGTGPGARLRLSSGGKGVVDYGAGTAFESSVAVSGQAVVVSLRLTGTVTYDFRTNGGLMSFTNVVANGMTTVTTTTGKSQAEPLTGSTDPAQYSCRGTTLTTYTAVYRSVMQRS